MSLSSLVENYANALRTLPGAVQVLDDVPAQLPDSRCFLVMEAPGDSTVAKHTGRAGGGVVYQCEDAIAIEYHHKIQRDATATSGRDARRMLDEVRNLLWSNPRRIDSSIIAVGSIRTEMYGPMDWGTDVTFGFRIVVNLTHAAEATQEVNP